MRQVEFTIVGISPYSQSRQLMEARKQGETPEDMERRCWRQRLHHDGKTVYIPPMALKSALVEAARFLSLRIPGKGKATYTKHFEAGLLATEPVLLNIKPEDVQGEWLSLSPTGKKGQSGVMRCMPRIDGWEGRVRMLVLDDTITEAVFREHLSAAGSLIGIGRFRPRNGGFYGRFEFRDLVMQDMAAGDAA